MWMISPLLPTDVRGVPRVDDRRVINGILWRKSRRIFPTIYGAYNPNRWQFVGVNAVSGTGYWMTCDPLLGIS